MLLATLCSEGLCVGEGKALDEGVRAFTDLVSLRSRMVFPCLQCRRLPAIQESGFASLGWEVPLEKEMATHSSILA